MGDAEIGCSSMHDLCEMLVLAGHDVGDTVVVITLDKRPLKLHEGRADLVVRLLFTAFETGVFVVLFWVVARRKRPLESQPLDYSSSITIL